MSEPNSQSRWTELLVQAVEEPGVIAAAYSAFHDYSLSNQLLAAFQCGYRGIPFGPIATYPGWQAKGRQVRKGEKALSLCMPVTRKTRDVDEDGVERELVRTFFVYRNNWFVVSQTDGPELEIPPVPGWDKERALKALGAREIPFQIGDGNAQGYAQGSGIAVSPVAAHPWKTFLHELAHVVLHTGDHSDDRALARSLREVEAECVALLVGEALGILEAPEESRGYIQHWLRTGGENAIPDRSAQRILGAADKILRAGQPPKETRAEAAA